MSQAQAWRWFGTILALYLNIESSLQSLWIFQKTAYTQGAPNESKIWSAPDYLSGIDHLSLSDAVLCCGGFHLQP
jgi:hypothetical protein